MTFAWKTVTGKTASALGVATAAACLIAAGSGGAQAQTLKKAIKNLPSDPVRVMVGGYFPAYHGARDALGQNFLSVGASLDVAPKTPTAQFIYSAYFDYLDRVKHNNGGRTEAVIRGGGVLTRYHFTPKPAGFDPYVGAGVGIYNVRLKENYGSSVVKVKTSLGGKFLTGAELPSHVFGEIEYDFVPRPERNGSKNKLNGYQARIGYRF